MILRGGELDGVRYLSEAAVAEMTGPAPRNEGCAPPQLTCCCGGFAIADRCAVCVLRFGLGWQVEVGAGFGHGGAMGTDLWIDTQAQRVTVLMVHMDGGAESDGGALRQAVKEWGRRSAQTAAL